MIIIFFGLIKKLMKIIKEKIEEVIVSIKEKVLVKIDFIIKLKNL